jgi:hypothetical protein
MRKVATYGSSISEKHWQADVLEMAQLFGWHCYHTYDSRRSTAGFPDLILVRPPVLIAAELKTAKGRVSPAQRAWLDDIAQCTDIRTHLWRPDDRDQVLDELCPQTIHIRLNADPRTHDQDPDRRRSAIRRVAKGWAADQSPDHGGGCYPADDL